MKLMKNIGTAGISFILFLAICLFASSATAQERRAGWDYTQYRSHGMSNCAFGAVGPSGQTVNVGTLGLPQGNVITVAAQKDLWVTLQMFCERPQDDRDEWGNLIKPGPPPTYTYTGSKTGWSIGSDTPGDVGPGHQSNFPKGWAFPVTVGSTPQTFTLTGSHADMGYSNSITVTVAPVTPPVSRTDMVGYVAPIQQQGQHNQYMAYQAYDKAEEATYSWERRSYFMGLSYDLNLRTLERSADAGHAITGEFGGTLGEDKNWKGVIGGRARLNLDQIAIVGAPNQPTNGFNQWSEWQRFSAIVFGGVNYMPTSWFALDLNVGVGPMLSFLGTIPETQLPDGTLFTGESSIDMALAGNADLSAAFCAGERVCLHTGVNLDWTFNQIQNVRGPEVTMDDAGNTYKMTQRRNQILGVGWKSGVKILW